MIVKVNICAYNSLKSTSNYDQSTIHESQEKCSTAPRLEIGNIAL